MFVMFGSMCLTCVLFAFAAVFRPDRRTLSLVFLPISILGVWGTGYRAFCSPDDWYRARAQNVQAWRARHPRWSVALFLVEIASFVWTCYMIVRKWI